MAAFRVLYYQTTHKQPGNVVAGQDEPNLVNNANTVYSIGPYLYKLIIYFICTIQYFYTK